MPGFLLSLVGEITCQPSGAGHRGLDARGLRPVHEWVGGFERFWNESFDRVDTNVQDLEQTGQEE